MKSSRESDLEFAALPILLADLERALIAAEVAATSGDLEPLVWAKQIHDELMRRPTGAAAIAVFEPTLPGHSRLIFQALKTSPPPVVFTSAS